MPAGNPWLSFCGFFQELSWGPIPSFSPSKSQRFGSQAQKVAKALGASVICKESGICWALDMGDPQPHSLRSIRFAFHGILSRSRYVFHVLGL